MKMTLCFAAILFTMLPLGVFAEGKPNADWAEQAALGYEEKAAAAEQAGDLQAAKIYARMAQIKRDAGVAAVKGEAFDWSEYHQLNEQLSKAGSKHGEQKQSESKPEKADPGEGFHHAAVEYRRLGIEAIHKADANKADIYLQLAEIKEQAADAAREGKEFDWARYHELKGRLAK